MKIIKYFKINRENERRGSKIKKMYIEGGRRVNRLSDIRKEILKCDDFYFYNSRDLSDCTYEMCLRIILNKEKTSNNKYEKNLLYRIIRSGGYTRYIEKLKEVTCKKGQKNENN